MCFTPAPKGDKGCARGYTPDPESGLVGARGVDRLARQPREEGRSIKAVSQIMGMPSAMIYEPAWASAPDSGGFRLAQRGGD